MSRIKIDMPDITPPTDLVSLHDFRATLPPTVLDYLNDKGAAEAIEQYLACPTRRKNVWQRRYEEAISRAHWTRLEEATRKAMAARLNNTLIPASLAIIEGVLRDTGETANARLAAASVVLRHLGVPPDEHDIKEPREMTPAELQSRIDALRGKVGGLA